MWKRVLIVPDKFKGTLTSEQAARAIERGVRRAWPSTKTTCRALTDGGEGFVEAMVRLSGGRLRTSSTTDAVGRRRRARWGVLGNGATAVIGLTEASGLAHLPPALRRTERTTNLGTGRLIARALQGGFRQVLVGLGGSATTEGGISLAVAVGYRFLDARGREISPNGAGLERLERIVAPDHRPRARFIVATDVGNPLFGPQGAAHQFAAQKGAGPALIRKLDDRLRRLARIVQRDLGKDFAHRPGAGAAGGCGYGLMVFFGAKREDGFQLLRREAALDQAIRAHDLVITGEGCFDRTSLLGKAPSQLGRLAARLNRPAWALCGRVNLSADLTPFDRLEGLPVHPDFENLSRAQHAKRLEELAFRVAREEGSKTRAVSGQARKARRRRKAH